MMRFKIKILEFRDMTKKLKLDRETAVTSGT